MNSKLNELFRNVTGVKPERSVKLTGDGSNRAYYRMTAGEISLLGAVGTSQHENKAFIALAAKFAECRIDVPEIYAVSEDGLCYIMQDLGDETLFMRMKNSRESGCFSHDDIDALCRVMTILPDIQFGVADGFDFGQCYPVSEFDYRSIMWDLNYFKYCFLKGVGVEFDENLLEDEFERMAALLHESEGNTFLYRDFQSRNVMWHEGRPWFIDFQGGRKGPIYYDVASFVGQARAKYPTDVVIRMVEAYKASLSRYISVEDSVFDNKLRLFMIFRLLQNLGTYGYRGIFERKKKFVETIPAALSRLKELLSEMRNEYPQLYSIILDVEGLPRFAPHDKSRLTVDVFSFSYHRGIPEDYSGNGGGFVFDCRSIHNPGRYEPYKKQTGRDDAVIKFLEENSNVAQYLDNVYSLVDEMVEEYLNRGFSHIQICFGCTGGQHRSVYCAERTAHHIAEKFAVRVNVAHKMQAISYTIEPKG